MLTVVVMYCLWLLLPSVGSRPPTKRFIDHTHLLEIAHALRNYEDMHGTLPPAFTVDSEGKPLHSWRTLILPYVDRQDIYDQIRFDEPWDSPHNSQFHNERLKIYQHPLNASSTSRTASYVVVVGPRTMFPGSTPVKRSDMDSQDGLEHTILLTSIQDSDIHWMEPRDLKFDAMDFQIGSPQGIGGFPDGVNAVFGDGGVRFLDKSLKPDAVKGAFTVDGGEPSIRE